MIRLSGVSKSYGRGEGLIRAVDEAGLEVAAGEFVMIAGPSGSGKTTLINLIAGLTRPDRGEVWVAGKNIHALKEPDRSRFRAKTIGLVFQFQSLLPALNALENVRLPLRFAGKPDDEARARSLLSRVGLADRVLAYAHELSAGQQRRVGIARALIVQPALLLCDEPTGDLDPETESAIMGLIAEAHHQGTTVLMATHNVALRSRATRQLRINHGRLMVSSF
jgi:putative ABC transport system ATP-binding protein